MTIRFALTAALVTFMAEARASAALFDPPPVAGAGALRGWVVAAQTGRADIVCIGDSNQAYGGHGWDHGVSRAASSRLGLFATGLHAAGENMGQGLGLGYGCSILGTACCVPQFFYTGAPAPLDGLMDADVFMYPMNYIYMPTGNSAGGSANLGLQVQASSALNVNARLRYEVTYGLFDGAGGSFRLNVRLGQAPWTGLISGPLVTTGLTQAAVTPPQAPWSTATLDLPAGARDAVLNPRFTPWGSDMTGPVILYTQRLINLDRSTGASVSTLYARGSQSARDMALGLLTASDEQLTLFFTRIRESQGPTKAILIRINSGANDPNEDLPSLGPANVQDANSPEAFADNHLAMVLRLQSLWISNGWDPTELYFLFSVTHPMANPDVSSLVSYRDAAEALALTLPRAAVTRFDRITNADEMLSMGWYQAGGTDRFHLTQPGFETLSERELDAIIAEAAVTEHEFSIPWFTVDAGGAVSVGGGFSVEGTAGQFDVGPGQGSGPFCLVTAYWEGGRLTSTCTGDLNADNIVNTLDLVLFLGAFGNPSPCGDGADFNYDGAVNTIDLTVFLGNFGVSCP